MIFEHEIPSGSKLYFGKAAKKKREIERVASELLNSDGFEEIVTPIFSYHQHKSVADEQLLIHLNDEDNHNMSLRADSTIDVVSIIEKRLGRNTTHKKWFYIQPVYKYPAVEQYQIGAEIIGEERLSVVLSSALSIFTEIEFLPLLQISNINIPKIISEMFSVTLDDFKHINISKLLSLDIMWLKKLIYLQYPHQIEELLEIVPENIRVELEKIDTLCKEISYKNTVIAPLYYAKMLYYDELYFRLIDKNDVFARGGRYVNNDTRAVGFAISSDMLIDRLSKEQ